MNFYNVFDIPKINSYYCKRGKNHTCTILNIPKECNRCREFELGIYSLYPPITLSMYMSLLKIAMRWGCVFGEGLDGRYYCYDNDEPSKYNTIYKDNLEECILQACIETKENCYEDVRKVFSNYLPSEYDVEQS